MARNVEIKARSGDLDDLRRRVEPLADGPPIELVQRDTFFGCRQGRLKLREFGDDSAELIVYRRPDSLGPKTSVYRVMPVDDPDALRDMLTTADGIVAVVEKRRTLFLIGRTRVHLDRVEGLGDFVELEVVLSPEESPADGERTARELMAVLEIEERDLVEGAYVDLLGFS